MNQFLYMLAGAAALAAAYGTFWVCREFLNAGKALTRAMNSVTDLVASNKSMISGLNDVSEQLKKLAGELEFLRTALTGGSPNFGPENPGAPGAPTPRQPLPSFPGAPPFIPVPDAEESDTEVTDTTDAELVEQERLEEIRGQGYEAEPLENPPGVTRDV